MTQQFKAFCFTVFTGGIIQAFIGNLWNLGHYSTMELAKLPKKVRGMCWSQNGPPPPTPNLTWMKNQQNKTHFMSKYDLRNLQMHMYIRPIFVTGYCWSEKQDFHCCIEWDYVCWFVIGMYMIQYEGKPLGTKRSRKVTNFNTSPWLPGRAFVGRVDEPKKSSTIIGVHFGCWGDTFPEEFAPKEAGFCGLC